MFDQRKYEDDNLYMLRLTARVFAVAGLTILFLFFLSENPDDLLNSTVNQLIGLMFFPVGLTIGLLLAWRRELLGGAIALGSVLAFYVIYGWLLKGSLAAAGWWFICFAIPGALFLAYGAAAAAGRPTTANQIEISNHNFYRIIVHGFGFVSRKARRPK